MRHEETGARAAGADAPLLEAVCEGVWKAPGARIIDRSGRKRLAIGDDGFERAAESGTLVDKTMLIADVGIRPPSSAARAALARRST